jgi:glycosyltransferase involved in cell wall biosynthesis
MRVAIICGAGIISGKEIMALELGCGLRDAGTNVHFITSRWGSGEFAQRAKAAAVPTDRMWVGYISATARWSEIRMTLDQMRRWPQLVFTYIAFLRTFRPNRIIHTNWHHALLLFPFLKWQRDIYWVHEVMPDKPQYRWLFRRLCAAVGVFVAVSEAVAEALVRVGVSPTQIKTIRNGIADPASDLETSAADRTDIGIIGQIGPWKGHEELLEAFCLVARRFPQLRLHIFGEGSPKYEKFLQARIETMELGSRVTWHGFVADRRTIYKTLGVVVVPSRFEEPFGLTALEAAFFGIPVVASNHGGLKEIVRHRITGLLFEPGNAVALSDCLRALVADPNLRKQLGAEARHDALARFSYTAFVQVFQQLLGETEMVKCRT